MWGLLMAKSLERQLCILKWRIILRLERGAVVESTWWTSTGPEFGSQYPHSGLQTFVSPVQIGNVLCLSWLSSIHEVHIHVDRQSTHKIKIIKSFKKWSINMFTKCSFLVIQQNYLLKLPQIAFFKAFRNSPIVTMRAWYFKHLTYFSFIKYSK